MATRLTHRLTKLEAALPKPKPECYCGITRMKDGVGVVRPGYILPHDLRDEYQCIGCKSCSSWVKFKELPAPNPDGTYSIVDGIRCGHPEYI